METLADEPVEIPQPILDPITAVNPPQTVHCAVCNEGIALFIRAPCNDVYCIPCLRELFEQATKDEELMPPRCCGENIPFELITSHLPVSLTDIFARKLEEHNTLDRLYCTNTSCGIFLGPTNVELGTIQCPECHTRICACFKKEANCSCKEDNETKEAIELCRGQGWQRCPGCQRTIELTHGCYHMTCLCRTEFCYLCGVGWKNCPCPHADEQRLLVDDVEYDPMELFCTEDDGPDEFEDIPNVTARQIEEHVTMVNDMVRSMIMGRLQPPDIREWWESFDELE